MTFARYARYSLIACLLLASAWQAAADDTLGAAYAAILRGDYDTGRATVEHLLKSGDTQAAQVRDWLDAYHQVVASRKELKAETFAWDIAQAKEALAADKTFLALNFVAQAVPYASDPNDVAAYPWVTELTERCGATAQQLQEADRWTNALNYYLLLSRIRPTDDELRARSENATRHARIELTYKDEKTLQERIRDVDKNLLVSTIKLIDRLYYQDPDFKLMARGALDNLTTVCSVTKLRGFLDGLANPALRRVPRFQGSGPGTLELICGFL